APPTVASNRHRQRGVVAIEFALMLMFGLIPLLWLTFTGVMVFAAKQSLTLAAADGARAALRYQPDMPARLATAESVGRARMHWLYEYSASDSSVAAEKNCSATASKPSTITVTASYDYESKPLFPATRFVVDKLEDK